MREQPLWTSVRRSYQEKENQKQKPEAMLYPVSSRRSEGTERLMQIESGGEQ